MTRLDFTPDSIRAQAEPLVIESETKIPEDFELSNEGLFYLEPRENKGGDSLPPAKIRVCSRLEVAAYSRDADSKNWGRLLRFKDPDGHQHQWAMPMELLKGGGEEYRGILLSFGLEIAPGRKNFERLTRYIQGSIPTRKVACVSQTGWHGACFVLPDQVFGFKKGDIVFQSSAEVPRLVKAQGSLDNWKTSVAQLCAGNSRLVFAVSCAFSAVLLQPLNGESCGFNFKGASSTGKSTALRLAASVFGPPEYVSSWRATTNGLEAQAMAHNDIIMVIDELGQVDPREAGDAMYLLCNGARKSRANQTGGARPTAHWRTRILSSGEIGLADHMRTAGKKSHAGQEIRLIDLPADAGKGLGLFEDLHGAIDGDAFAKLLKDNCKRSFGSSGLRFIELCVERHEELATLVKPYVDGLMRILPAKCSGQVQRAAYQFALTGAAGELATRFGVTGWSEGEAASAAKLLFEEWLLNRGSAGDLEDKTIVNQVRAFIEQHGESRFPRLVNGDRKDDSKTTINRAGFVEYSVQHGCDVYYIFRQAWQNEVCSGVDHKRAARVLADLDIIIRDAKRNPAISRRIPGVEGTIRVYAVKATLLSDDSETDERNTGVTL